MSMLRTLMAAGATLLLAGAALADPVQSSCPDPCTNPPKSALFVRQPWATLGQSGDITPLVATMRGVRKTVLRVDANVDVASAPGLDGVYVLAYVNGYTTAIIGSHSFPCAPGVMWGCSATGTLWFDIDALEAMHPGQFVNQPLSIRLEGGNTSFGAVGAAYTASFAAQAVKKK